MNEEQRMTATACLAAAYDGSMAFPEIVGRLIGAGFEGYMVDYRRHRQIYYLPDGASIECEAPHLAGTVAATFDPSVIASLVARAQAGGPEYSYQAFCAQAKAAGCAGYLVSFLGRRVVYLGRTGETHTEHFPV